MAIKIQRQTASASSASPPSTLPYGELACDKTAVLYVGNSSNYPVKMMDENSYNQVGNPNLLDNSDFTNPVNQRGSSSYTSTTGYVYCIDRWRLYYGTYNVDSASIPAANTTRLFTQKLDIASTTQYSASFLVNGEKYSVSVESIEEKESYTLATSLVETEDFIFHLYKSAADYVNYLFEIKANKTFAITWAKLEKGSAATPYVPKGYGAELAECRRCYYRFPFRYSATHVQAAPYPTVVPVQFPVTMRISPTITFAKQWDSGVTSISSEHVSTGGCGISINAASGALMDVYYTVNASADL